MDLAVRDAEAYRRWSELHKERPENDPELLSATEDILQIPATLATLSLELLRECVRLAPKTNPRLGSDLGIAGQLAAGRPVRRMEHQGQLAFGAIRRSSRHAADHDPARTRSPIAPGPT